MKLIIEARMECTDSDLRREPKTVYRREPCDRSHQQDQNRGLCSVIFRNTSPLSQALPKRITPALEYLQVKWAAHLPYAAATALLKEVLPLQNAISTSSAKSRMRTAGRELDARIEREILAMPKADTAKKAIEATRRATRADGTTKVVAYVGKRVVSAAARLDHFLVQQGVKPDERVTVISDGAGEFVKAVEGSQFARRRILDWFHIAMRFRVAEQSILSARQVRRDDFERQYRTKLMSQVDLLVPATFNIPR